VLRYAAIAEAGSEHPLGGAILSEVTAGSERSLQPVSLNPIPGVECAPATRAATS
jgi:cation transport ATPase